MSNLLLDAVLVQLEVFSLQSTNYTRSILLQNQRINSHQIDIDLDYFRFARQRRYFGYFLIIARVGCNSSLAGLRNNGRSRRNEQRYKDGRAGPEEKQQSRVSIFHRRLPRQSLEIIRLGKKSVTRGEASIRRVS